MNHTINRLSRTGQPAEDGKVESKRRLIIAVAGTSNQTLACLFPAFTLAFINGQDAILLLRDSLGEICGPLRLERVWHE